MNSRKRKRSVSQLFHSRFHNSRFFWQSAEDSDWLNMAPVGWEFGSPDYDRLMQQEVSDLRSNLSSHTPNTGQIGSVSSAGSYNLDIFPSQ